MKRDSHEHLLPSDGFYFDYGVDIDAEIDELHIRHRLPLSPKVSVDRGTVVFGTTFVFMFCLIATLIITSVEGGLVA